MQTDRTTKTLLFLIAAALWGLLLRPAFAPTPGIAAAGIQDVNIVRVGGASVFGGSVPVDVQRQPIRVRNDR